MTKQKKIPLMKPDMGEEEYEAIRKVELEIKVNQSYSNLQFRNRYLQKRRRVEFIL